MSKYLNTNEPCINGHVGKILLSGECEVCKSNQYSINYSKKYKERILLAKAKNRAKRKKIEFNIDITDVVIPDICPVLGIPIERTSDSKRFVPGSPTIDRIDNNKGYIKGNVMVISHRANALKWDATLSEIRLVLKHLEKYLVE